MNQEHEIVLYQIDDTNVCVSVIYKDGELKENSTAEIFSVVQKEGKRDVRRNVACYNLDAIIAVGYCVNLKNTGNLILFPLLKKPLSNFLL